MSRASGSSASPATMTRRRFLQAATVGATAYPLAVAGAPVAAGTAAATADDVEGDAAMRWFDLVLDLIRTTPGYTPPVASRALAYAGVALYEAVAPGMPAARSLLWVLGRAGRSRSGHDPRGLDWEVAANAALATIVRHLFPTMAPAARQRVDDLEDALTSTTGRARSGALKRRSAHAGSAAARVVAAGARTDGGQDGHLHNFPSDYVPPAGPGLWIPTPPGHQPALQPYWGANRTFVLNVAAESEPAPPPAFSTVPGSRFHADAVEVYEAVRTLTAEQRAIARFWADDPGATATPPGHSVSVLTQLLAARGASLGTAAETYARLGVAVSDAFVCCWATKYRYHLVRPITFIREHIDPTWGNPLPVTTPPFPEYTSGHSVQSGAAAKVLTAAFGDVPFTDRTHDRLGLAPRSFASFAAMAEEAAISRLYGGIHYRPAIEEGLRQGGAIGATVAALELRR